MLRACEFAARLKFRMEPELVTAIAELKGEIRKSAPPRVTEEFLDPLRRGWGHDTYRLWSESGLLGVLLPELDAAVASHDAPFSSLFWKMLHDLDARKAAGARAPRRRAPLGPLPAARLRGHPRPRQRRGPRRPVPDPPRPRGRREPARPPDVSPEPDDAPRQADALHARPADVDASRPPRGAPPRRPLVVRPFPRPPVALLQGLGALPRRRRGLAGRPRARGEPDDVASSPLPGTPAPFPEALVPPPALARAHAGAAIVPMPGEARPAGRKRRRRGGRRHAPGGAAG